MAESGNNASQTNGTESTDHVAIKITELDQRLANSLKLKLADASSLPLGRPCIYRVHEKFSKINQHAYIPEMISIGPFHCNNPRFEYMENHKLRYVENLLSRTDTSLLEECFASIRLVEEKARRCYSEPISLGSNEFVDMMVVDGLFIIELFYKIAKVVPTHRADPIFNNLINMPSLLRDMILLENQIPMCVLCRLFRIVARNQNQNQESHTLAELVVRFFNPLMKRDDRVLANYFNKKGKHLLDLFSKTFHDFEQNGELERNGKFEKLKHIRCVTELREAGVKFKKNTSARSFLDIKFKDGVLEIPPIVIQDQTNCLLRNFVAFEQCCDGRDAYMTSYAFFMDSLINSVNDVKFLVNHGIIENCLGDGEEVSSLFNKLGSEVTLVDFYYHDLCDNVNKYLETRWPRWRATLMHDYFNNPWVGISVCGASLLLILAVIATLFAVLSFTVHKS